nr:putative gas vesicle protein [uncultured bacterium]
MTELVTRGTTQPAASSRGTSLADLLERVLDRGVVIAGDVVVSVLDIELLTLKLRLLVVSADTAREMGINWWEHDPFLTGEGRRLQEENRELRRKLDALERATSADRPSLPSAKARKAPKPS